MHCARFYRIFPKQTLFHVEKIGEYFFSTCEACCLGSAKTPSHFWRLLRSMVSIPESGAIFYLVRVSIYFLYYKTPSTPSSAQFLFVTVLHWFEFEKNVGISKLCVFTIEKLRFVSIFLGLLWTGYERECKLRWVYHQHRKDLWRDHPVWMSSRTYSIRVSIAEWSFSSAILTNECHDLVIHYCLIRPQR